MPAALISIYLLLASFHAAGLASRPSAQSNAQDIAQLQSQADAGDTSAQMKLGRAYLNGDGVAKDEAAAFKWYKKAAEQGNAEAHNLVGEMYRAGEGVDKNKEEALRWYHLSARQGNADAMCNLGAAYYNGDGTDVNDSLSYSWFLMAKEKGCTRAAEAVGRAESQLNPEQIEVAYDDLARMFETAGVLPADQSAAVHWWQQAATRGDHDAEFALSAKLVVGEGIGQDVIEARRLCDKIRKTDIRRAAVCAAYSYQNGPESSRDLKKARNLYSSAASSEFPAAMLPLAQMEAGGEGGKIDRVGAAVLYARLIERGDREALTNLIKLKSQMNAKEWANVEKQLPTFRISPAKVDALLQHASAH
jgi:TPR repeat protein